MTFGSIPSDLLFPPGKTFRRSPSGSGFDFVEVPTGTSSTSPISPNLLSALEGTDGIPGELNRFVTNSDPRNSNTRIPTAHQHSPSEISGIAVITSDARLSDARLPLTHSHAPSEVTGTAVITNDARLSDARVPLTHSHVKADVGLNNVDNTTDLGKPISTATQTALDTKLDDTQFSGLTKISVGTLAPIAPSAGDLWIDTN